MSRTVNCIKLKREAEGLDRPPLPGELGNRLFESVSKEAWRQWLARQTMIINENRLKLSDPGARKYLSEQVTAHFFGDGPEPVVNCMPQTPPTRTRWTLSGLE